MWPAEGSIQARIHALGTLQWLLNWLKKFNASKLKTLTKRVCMWSGGRGGIAVHALALVVQSEGEAVSESWRWHRHANELLL